MWRHGLRWVASDLSFAAFDSPIAFKFDLTEELGMLLETIGELVETSYATTRSLLWILVP